MTKLDLDDIFRVPASDAIHPRLRHWKQRLAQPGVDAKLELYRPEAALGLVHTEIHLHFFENGKPLQLDSISWDDELNSGLVRLKVRAVDLHQEAERFAMGLRAALKQAERTYGDGYLNSVLVELVRESDLTRYQEVADVLQHVTSNRPYRQAEGARMYNECREMIADAIAARAQELTGPLGYSKDEAKQILVKALARYIDERFSVTNRRRMGLL